MVTDWFYDEIKAEDMDNILTAICHTARATLNNLHLIGRNDDVN